MVEDRRGDRAVWLILLVVVASAACFFTKLGADAMTLDESTYALCTRSIL